MARPAQNCDLRVTPHVRGSAGWPTLPNGFVGDKPAPKRALFAPDGQRLGPADERAMTGAFSHGSIARRYHDPRARTAPVAPRALSMNHRVPSRRVSREGPAFREGRRPYLSGAPRRAPPPLSTAPGMRRIVAYRAFTVLHPRADGPQWIVALKRGSRYRLCCCGGGANGRRARKLSSVDIGDKPKLAHRYPR
jgi:hypothetical protein